ncbi:MAG TPA: HAD-IA family hydrolase [Anaerolineae bacterium]|nr:HAD-IA family hydrolase [Anaerolineae bacterium]HQI85563.1 HAD-IA family hydrolase [Anaerolineae bacterium]
MIKYLIWDAGGTLFDTYPAVVEACRVALNGFGKDAPSEWVLALCKQTTSHGIHTLADMFSLNEETFQQHFKQSYEDIGEQYQPPFPGVEDVCRYICEIGGQNFIVTHRPRASLQTLLAVHGMTHYFTDFIAQEDPYPRKPDPAAINALIERHALDRVQCLVIGDRELDIVAGQRAGVRTCLFGAAVSAVQPDLIIEDFATLLHWLEAENTNCAAG